MSLAVEETFVFQLSDRVLDSLQLLYFDSLTAKEATTPLTVANLNSHNESVSANSSATTPTVKDKEYYKSDLHRFNLKRELSGLPPVSEEEFDQIIQDLDESISGSDSSEYSETEQQDKLETVFEKSIQKLEAVKLEEENESVVSHLATRSPYILFKSNLLPNDKCFGVFKTLFTIEQLEKPLETLKSWKSSSKPAKSALFMIGGGHFSGAIINHKPKSIKGNTAKAGESIIEQSVDLLEHKSFHRYTTRRKQGGSQSASDNSRGMAKSVGSSLRRQNEAALQNEIRELLNQWRKHLDECEFIFVRANGSANKSILIGYENSPLKNDDTRIRSFPFTTKRATASEVKKAWCQLVYLSQTERPKIDHLKLKQIESKRQKELSKISNKKSTTTEGEKGKELSEDEKHTVEIVNYLKKSKGPILISYLKKNKLSANFQFEPKSEYFNTPTILHFAASHGLRSMIPVLIKTAKCDPTITNDNGKTAYDVSANPQIKQVFQFLRFELGENYLNWNDAHVGEPLNREVVENEEKLQQELEKKRLIKEQLDKKVEIAPTDSSKKKLFSGSSISEINLNSLSDDQRMRLMREQRARAAEMRFKSQQQQQK